MGSQENRQIIMKKTERSIAVATKQTPNTPGLVVMIYHKALFVSRKGIALTDRANPSLRNLHPLEVFRRQVEPSQDPLPAITRNAQALPAPKLLDRFFSPAPTTSSRLGVWINRIFCRTTATGKAQPLGMPRRAVEKECGESTPTQTTADLCLSQILRRRLNALSQSTSNRPFQPTLRVLFGYNDFGQDVNLRERFVFWLSPFGLGRRRTGFCVF
jgi:hypothetical protein